MEQVLQKTNSWVVVGRMEFSSLSNYMLKLDDLSTHRTRSVAYFEPERTEDVEGYNAAFEYFKSKERIAVLRPNWNTSKQEIPSLEEIFVFPLCANQTPPEFLHFRNGDLPSKDLLVAVLVARLGDKDKKRKHHSP